MRLTKLFTLTTATMLPLFAGFSQTANPPAVSQSTPPKHLLAPLAAFCAIAALVGCASTNPQVSGSWFDQKKVELAEALAPAPSPPVILDERAFQKLDLDADGAIALDEWQHFETSASPKENVSALDDNGDGQINVTELPTQAPKHSKRYHFFGDTDKTDDGFVSSEKEGLQQPGWHLFSFNF